MNETIIESIRDPWSHKYKNRLLKRCGGFEYLLKKPNYNISLSKAPILKENKKVYLFSNGIFNVNKKIGVGSNANIYLISNKIETYALKVN